jgi:autotransporter-associated beta strand protein
MLAAGLCALTSAQAGTKTWTGSGGNFWWATAGNWDLGAPVNGDSLVFSGSTGYANTNTIANLIVNGIAFNNGGFQLFNTNAQALVTNNGPILNSGGNNTNNIILNQAAALTIENDGGNLAFGAITNNGFGITVTGSGNNVFFNGVIAGTNTAQTIQTGGLTVNWNGGGIVRLGAANYFVGGLNIQAGTVQTTNTGIPSGPGRGDVTIANGSELDMSGNSVTINGLTGSGTIGSLNSPTASTVYTLTVGNNATNASAGNFSGRFDESGSAHIGLTKINTNSFILNSGNPYSGPTVVSAGTFTVTSGSSLSSSPSISVAPGALLDISGIAGGLNLLSFQSLTAGATNNGSSPDIIGSLNSGGTIYVNAAGPGTLTLHGDLDLQGMGAIAFDLSTNTAPGGGTNDLIAVNGNLTIGNDYGGPTMIELNPIYGTFASTPYTLISNLTGAAIGGSLANLTTSVGRGQSASFSQSSGNLMVTVSGTAVPASLVWAPSVTSTNWDVTLTKNFNNGGNADYFYQLDNVTFDDTASNGLVNLPGGVSPASITLNNVVSNYMFTGPGSIAGVGNLTKNGAGQLVIRVPCGYTGSTILNGGITLIDFTNGPVPTVLYNNVASGPLVLGGATLLASCRASVPSWIRFSGTTVNAGDNFVNQTTRASSASPAVYLAGITRNVGGTLDLGPNTGSSSSQTVTNVGIFTTNANLAGAGIQAGWMTYNGGSEWARTNGAYGQYGGNHLYGGATYYNAFGPNTNTDMTANLAAGAGAHTATVRFNTTGGKTLTLNGANVIDLGGILVTPTAAASASTVSGGTSLTSGNGTDLIVIQADTSAALTIATPIVNNGTTNIALTKSGAGMLILTTANAYSGNTYLNNGTLQLGNGGTTGGLGSSGIVFNNGTLAFNRSDALVYSDAISGSGGLKVVAGDVTLTGANTCTGPVTVTAGTLRVGNGGTSGSIATASSISDSGSLVFNRSDNLTYAGVISGTGSITQQGAGVLTLTRTNTYLGATTISGGTLALGPSASIASSSSITLGSGATLSVAATGGLVLNNQTLAGSGAISGSLTVPTNSILIPGGAAAIGTLTLNNDLNVSGGQLTFDLSTSTHDLINVAGGLALNSGRVTVNVLGGSLANGTYRLINYSGSLTGGAANLSVAGFSQAGQIAQLVDGAAGLDLVVSTFVAQNLVWQGASGANWDYTTANWLNGSTVADFVDYDNVTFNDTASTTGTIYLNATLSPAQVTVDNASASYIFSGSGKLTGGAALTKNNTGSLTITTANDNSGQTTVNGGTLQVGDGSTTGTSLSAGNVAVNSGGTLTFNQPDTTATFAGVISGAGNVVQAGATTLALSGNNTLSGTISNLSGTLQVGANGTTGSLGSAPVVNNGTLLFMRSGTVAQSGAISGTGALVVNCPGALVLSGNNTYTGNTVVTNGTLKLGASEVIPDGSTVNLDLAGTLDLNGFNETIGGLTGTLAYTGKILNNAGSAVNTLTISSSNTAALVYNGSIADNSGSGGAVALVVLGTGSLRLNNASQTYGGGTYVGGGALILGGGVGSLGSGGIVLSNGTTLSLLNTGSSANNVGSTITVPTGATAAITGNSTAANGLYGSFVGDTNSTLSFTNNLSLNGGNLFQFASFNGKVVQSPAGSSGSSTLRFSQSPLSNGGSNTTFDVEGQLETKSGTGSGVGIVLGQLTGAGSLWGADTANGGTTLYVIGSKNLDSTFSGAIGETSGNGATAITKVGAGKLTLSGTLSYTGTTTVKSGILALSGSAALSSTNIAVQSGASLDVSAAGGTLSLGAQTLTGSGTVAGNVLGTGASSALSPGDTTGALTINGWATNSGAITMQINVTNASMNSELIASRIDVNGATLTVTNLGPTITNGTKFTLFSPVPTGTLSATNLTTGSTNYVWKNDIAVDGSITLLGGGIPADTTRTNLSAAYSGGLLTLTWPTNHLGWYIQSNSVGLDVTNSWFNVPNSQGTNQIVLTPDLTKGEVFYRMVYTNK